MFSDRIRRTTNLFERLSGANGHSAGFDGAGQQEVEAHPEHARMSALVVDPCEPLGIHRPSRQVSLLYFS